VILGGGVAVCLLLSAHRVVIFAIVQFSCSILAGMYLRSSGNRRTTNRQPNDDVDDDDDDDATCRANVYLVLLDGERGC